MFDCIKIRFWRTAWEPCFSRVHPGRLTGVGGCSRIVNDDDDDDDDDDDES